MIIIYFFLFFNFFYLNTLESFERSGGRLATSWCTSQLTGRYGNIQGTTNRIIKNNLGHNVPYTKVWSEHISDTHAFVTPIYDKQVTLL